MRKGTLLLFVVLVGIFLRHVDMGRQPVVDRLSGVAMTMHYEVKVEGRGPTAQVQEVITRTFAEIHAIFNQWNPDSEASLINALAAHVEYTPSPLMLRFLHLVEDVVKVSEGRFDPTIGPVKALWLQHLKHHTTPKAKDIESIREHTGWDKFVVGPKTLVKRHDLVTLNFDSVAKGFAVDLLVERLAAIGYKNIYVEWGGEIRTHGGHPSGRPWRISIRGLDSEAPQDALAHFNFSSGAIATSGDYLQHWEVQKGDGTMTSYTHIVDPLTCRLIERGEGRIASVSVVTQSCAIADALATAAYVYVHPEDAKKWFIKVQETYPNATLWVASRKKDES